MFGLSKFKNIIDDAKKEIEQKQILTILSSMSDAELMTVVGITRKDIPDFINKITKGENTKDKI